MKTALLLLIAATALSRLSPPVYARAGDLEKPGVALAADYPAEAAQQIRTALSRPDCKYLGGNFVNAHTSLCYSGTTDALSGFLYALAKCPGAIVTVGFTHDRLPKDGADWHVSHRAYENNFFVRINLESKQIDLSKLLIPAAIGPALSAAKP